MSTTCPPLPRAALFGEIVVHGSDIRRPLGLGHRFSTEHLEELARYYAGSDQVVLAKSRVEGLRLVASDSDFIAGAGPIVEGPTLALIMAMTGRSAYCDDLTGDGVGELRNRSTMR